MRLTGTPAGRAGRTDRAVRRMLGLTVLLVLVAAGSAAALLWQPWTATGSARPPSAQVVSASPAPADATPATVTTPRSVGSPARLQIPSIGVDAKVVALGLDAHGNLGVPSDPVSVAWYTGSAHPGEVGSAVINGHVDWTNGDSVFGRLKELRTGDQVTVTAVDGERVVFAVSAARLYPADAHPVEVFARGGPPVLRLITCGGPYNLIARRYEQRLVVSADPAA